ncbi:MAG TPA: DUF4235 domain-containing protein [Solirubrobacterales bacterium]|nr:DUF4235 domain-containing protein [Solirubrobacterales bacterium]
MAKVLFIPVSIVGGLIAGLVGKKIFETAWGLIDKEEPPESEHREVSWLKLIAALAAEGAIFRATRGAVDHVARRGFYRATGTWPGEERPEREFETA